MSTYDIDDNDFAEGIKAANQDMAVGKHTFEVVDFPVEKTTQDGREYLEVNGVLASYMGQQVRLYLNPASSSKEIKETTEGWKRRAMGNNNESIMALKKLGKSPTKLAPGDTFKVLVSRDKPKEGRELGFLRIVKVLGAAGDGNSTEQDSDIKVNF